MLKKHLIFHISESAFTVCLNPSVLAPLFALRSDWSVFPGFLHLPSRHLSTVIAAGE